MLRRVVARRAVWVAIGPWAGFLFLLAVFLGFEYLTRLGPSSEDRNRFASWQRDLGLTRC